MDYRDALDRAVDGIDLAQFYDGFLDEVKRLLSRVPAGTELPAQVVQDVAKWVETQQRTMTEDFSGHRLEPNIASGVGLINAMQDCGLLRRDFTEPEPIYFLFRWYVSQRNVAAHGYPTYPWSSFLTFFWVSNYVLTETLRRKSNPRATLMDLRISPIDVIPGQLIRITASFPTPVTGRLFDKGEFNVLVRWANNQVRAAPLSFNAEAQIWQTDLPSSGAVPGEFMVLGEAHGPLGDFVSMNPKKGKIVL